MHPVFEPKQFLLNVTYKVVGYADRGRPSTLSNNRRFKALMGDIIYWL
jgi:hypothetical protein